MITISQIYRPLGVTARQVEFYAFQNGIHFERKINKPTLFTNNDANRLIEIIKREKEVSAYAKLSDVAKDIGVYQAIVNSYMKTLKIQKHVKGFSAYVAKCDIPKILEHHAKILEFKSSKSKEILARREYHRMRYQLRKDQGEFLPRTAEDNHRLSLEAELYAIKQAKEHRTRSLTVCFYHKNGKIYTGIIIGGLNRVNEETVMIRYIDQGCKFIAEVRYSAVISKTFNEVAELVRIAKIKREE